MLNRHLFWALGLILLSACSPAAAGPTPSGLTPSVTPPEPTPVTPGAPIPIEIARLFQPVQAHIAASLNASPEQVVLVSYEARNWPNSCLGVMEATSICMDVITPGYLAVFDTPQGQVEAHMDRSATNIRLVTLPTQVQRTPPAVTAAPGTSGISGQILLGPACPGPVRIDQPCPDQPYQAEIYVLSADGRQEITRFQSDLLGLFQVPLPPGDYLLRPIAPDAYPNAEEIPVTVRTGEFTPVQILYDSGIR